MATALYDDTMPGLNLGLRPANERRRYKVTVSLIDWAQTWYQPWYTTLSKANLNVCIPHIV